MPKDKNDSPPPHSFAALSDEQLSDLYQLAALDPEVTQRLARALDKLQLARPYQPLTTSHTHTSAESSAALQPTINLSEEERAAQQAFVASELNSLLLLAAQLSHVYELQPSAQPDSHFKNKLKAELTQQAEGEKRKVP